MPSNLVCYSRSIIVDSPEYLDTKLIPQTSDDLTAHNWIQYSLRSNLWDKFKGIESNLQSNTGFALLAATKQGIGITMIPCWLAHESLQD